VVQKRILSPAASCTISTCEVSVTMHWFLPPSVAKTELAKPFYDYLGLSLANGGSPPAPKFMRLRHDWKTGPKTGGARGEHSISFQFSFSATARHYVYVVDVCTIDTESLDGFGLPGHHGCGSTVVPVSTGYLG